MYDEDNDTSVPAGSRIQIPNVTKSVKYKVSMHNPFTQTTTDIQSVYESTSEFEIDTTG